MIPIIMKINAKTPKIIAFIVDHSLKTMTPNKVVEMSCNPVEIGIVLETPIKSMLLS